MLGSSADGRPGLSRGPGPGRLTVMHLGWRPPASPGPTGDIRRQGRSRPDRAEDHAETSSDRGPRNPTRTRDRPVRVGFQTGRVGFPLGYLGTSAQPTVAAFAAFAVDHSARGGSRPSSSVLRDPLPGPPWRGPGRRDDQEEILDGPPRVHAHDLSAAAILGRAGLGLRAPCSCSTERAPARLRPRSPEPGRSPSTSVPSVHGSPLRAPSCAGAWPGVTPGGVDLADLADIKILPDALLARLPRASTPAGSTLPSEAPLPL